MSGFCPVTEGFAVAPAIALVERLIRIGIDAWHDVARIQHRLRGFAIASWWRHILKLCHIVDLRAPIANLVNLISITTALQRHCDETNQTCEDSFEKSSGILPCYTCSSA